MNSIEKLIAKWRKLAFDSTFIDKVHHRPTAAGCQALTCADELEQALARENTALAIVAPDMTFFRFKEYIDCQHISANYICGLCATRHLAELLTAAHAVTNTCPTCSRRGERRQKGRN
jgi:hypothetical protein